MSLLLLKRLTTWFLPVCVQSAPAPVLQNVASGHAKEDGQGGVAAHWHCWEEDAYDGEAQISFPSVSSESDALLTVPGKKRAGARESGVRRIRESRDAAREAEFQGEGAAEEAGFDAGDEVDGDESPVLDSRPRKRTRDGKEEAGRPRDGKEEAGWMRDGKEEAGQTRDGKEEAGRPRDGKEDAGRTRDGKEGDRPVEQSMSPLFSGVKDDSEHGKGTADHHVRPRHMAGGGGKEVSRCVDGNRERKQLASAVTQSLRPPPTLVSYLEDSAGDAGCKDVMGNGGEVQRKRHKVLDEDGASRACGAHLGQLTGRDRGQEAPKRQEAHTKVSGTHGQGEGRRDEMEAEASVSKSAYALGFAMLMPASAKDSAQAIQQCTGGHREQQHADEAAKSRAKKKEWDPAARPAVPNKHLRDRKIAANRGAEDCLEGMTFVITGVLDSMERDECKDLILRYGGKVTTSVSGKTTYLIIGVDAGERKQKKACEIGLKQIDEDGLFALIKASGEPVAAAEGVARAEHDFDGDTSVEARGARNRDMGMKSAQRKASTVCAMSDDCAEGSVNEGRRRAQEEGQEGEVSSTGLPTSEADVVLGATGRLKAPDRVYGDIGISRASSGVGNFKAPDRVGYGALHRSGTGGGAKGAGGGGMIRSESAGPLRAQARIGGGNGLVRSATLPTR
jgi:hypothetical protein